MKTERDLDALIRLARGSVDPDLLTETGAGGLLRTGYFSESPLIDYLEPEEQPHFLLTNKKSGIKVDSSTSSKRIVPGNRYRTGVLVTDQRVLCVVGKSNGDRIVEIPHRQNSGTETSTGFFRDKLIISSYSDQFITYTKKKDDTKNAAEYIEKRGKNAVPVEGTEMDISSDMKSTADGNGVDTAYDSKDHTDTQTVAQEWANGPVGNTTQSTVNAENTVEPEPTDKDTEKIAAGSGGLTVERDDFNQESSAGDDNETSSEPNTHEGKEVEALDEEFLANLSDGEFRTTTPTVASSGATSGEKAEDFEVYPNSEADYKSPPREAGNGDEEVSGSEGQDPPSSRTTDTEPPLPTPQRVATVDTRAAQYVELAETHLSLIPGEVKREEKIRAHSDLCFALDILSEEDNELVAELEEALTELETTLGGLIDENNAEPEEKSNISEITFEVIVRDETDEPIQGATISLDNNTDIQPLETDAKGRCRISATDPPDEVTLSIDRHGYESITATVPVQSQKVYDIQLVPEEIGDETGASSSTSDELGTTDEAQSVTREALLAELRRLDEEWSRDIDKRLLYSVGEYKPEEYEREFGSLESAIEAAKDLEPESTAPEHRDAETEETQTQSKEAREETQSKEQTESETDTTTETSRREKLLDELRRLDDGGRQYIDKLLLHSVSEYDPEAYKDEFGSLDNAIAAAGVEGDSEKEPNLEDEEETDLEKAIKQAGLGEKPAETAEEKPGAPTEEDPGGETEEESATPSGEDTDSTIRDELLADLRRLDNEWQKNIDRRLIFTLGEYHPDAYEEEFGSLENAIEAAALSQESHLDNDNEPKDDEEETTAVDDDTDPINEDGDILDEIMNDFEMDSEF